MDARDFEPMKLEVQIKELALNYARLIPCRSAPSPTNPCHTEPVERENAPSQICGTPHIYNSEVSTEIPSKRKVHYIDNNRLVLQRIRDGNIWDRHSTSIPDHGICFDKDGNPWEKNDPRSRHQKIGRAHV